MEYMKLNSLKFGLSWGIVLGVCVFITLISNILISGYAVSAAEVIKSIYEPFVFGLEGVISAVLISIYSFVDVFIISFVFALIYNKLV